MKPWLLVGRKPRWLPTRAYLAVDRPLRLLLQRRGLIILVLLFAALQFLPVYPMADEPVRPFRSLASSTNPTTAVSHILERSCVNCHSHQSPWPWYGNIAPVSWLIRKDVLEARKAMNFSFWRKEPRRRPGMEAYLLLAARASLNAGLMPPPQYLALHPEAKPSAADVETSCGWSNVEARRLTMLKQLMARQKKTNQPRIPKHVNEQVSRNAPVLEEQTQ